MATRKTIVHEAEVMTKRDGDDLVITIAGLFAAQGVASASGKSLVLASTRGNIMLEEGVKMGLNLYRSKA